jgi:hypothetical protein
MSLVTNISDAITRIATEIKAVYSTTTGNTTGSLAGLTTVDKSSLLAAINELKSAVDSAGSGSGDLLAANNLSDLNNVVTARSNLSVYSTAETNNAISNSIATAVSGLGDLKAANNLSDLVNATFARTNLGVYSASETDSAISVAINNLLDSAPGTLNTLNELAAALGDDPNFAASTTAALANRVRTDTATQGLTATQQSNARANIGAVSTANIGNTATDFVATFESGLLA